VKDNRLYLSNIAECIERIETYTQDGQDAFMQSTLIQDAVIRNFEIIGEATKQISQELRQKHLDIPWRRVAGFRDVLIHNYMSAVLDEVWLVVERDLPILKRRIKEILQSLKGSDDPTT
jgi:uncharacterized protein with HEPN domain